MSPLWQTTGTYTRHGSYLYNIRGDCIPLLLINEVSKVTLGGLVAIYSNLEETISLCPLNPSIILSDTQRSLQQCVQDHRPTHKGALRISTILKHSN